MALALIAIVRAAQAVRIARRDGLRGDYEQDVHEALTRALDAAGFCKDKEPHMTTKSTKQTATPFGYPTRAVAPLNPSA